MFESERREKKTRLWFEYTILSLSGLIAVLMFLLFSKPIVQYVSANPIITNLMFVASALTGLVFGTIISNRFVQDKSHSYDLFFSESAHSPYYRIKESVYKLVMMAGLIASLFAAVALAMRGSINAPVKSFQAGLRGIEYFDPSTISDIILANADIMVLGLSCLFFTGIAVKSMIASDILPRKICAFVTLFVMVSIIMTALTDQYGRLGYHAYVFVFYYAGLLSGVFYQMNKQASSYSSNNELGSFSF